MIDALRQKNNSYIIVSPLKDYRWLDAFGNVKKYIPYAGEPTDDTTGEPDAWVNTETGSNTWLNSATAGEDFTITTGATDFNGYSSQLKGEQFIVKSGYPFYVGGQFKLSVADQSDFLFGLCETDTTLTAASATHAIAVGGDGVFFSKLDAATAINFHLYGGGSQSAVVPVGTMDTSYHYYEIVSEDGVTVKFYFDGVFVSSFVANVVCDGDLTPSISVRNGASAAVTLSVKDFKCIQVF